MKNKINFILLPKRNTFNVTSCGIIACCIRRMGKLPNRFPRFSFRVLSCCFYWIIIVCCVVSLGAWPTRKPPCLQRSCNNLSGESGTKMSFSSFDDSLSQLREGDLKAAAIFLKGLEKEKGPQTGAPLQSLLSNLSDRRDPSIVDADLEVNPCDSSYYSSKSTEFLNKSIQTALSSPKSTPDHNQNLLVFVSFSLGDSTLKQLFRDVQKIGGQLVMRGLYKNSFIQTQKKIQDLKIVVDIDPTLFERFQIQEVPTFIIVKELETEGVPPHDRLKGNVFLTYALEIFEQSGNKKAAEFLKKEKESSHV